MSRVRCDEISAFGDGFRIHESRPAPIATGACLESSLRRYRASRRPLHPNAPQAKARGFPEEGGPECALRKDLHDARAASCRQDFSGRETAGHRHRCGDDLLNQVGLKTGLTTKRVPA